MSSSSSLSAALLNPQIPKIFSLLPTHPFPIFTSTRRFSPLTLTLSPKPSSLSPHSFSSSFDFSPNPPQKFIGNDDDEDEVVIGDCLVFEEGVFEDSYIEESFGATADKPQNSRTKVEVEPEDLIPEKWKRIQAQINLTKKERRKMAQELEFGRTVEKKKRGLVPLRNVSVEDYMAYKEAKMSQLKPLVLDSPTFSESESISSDDDGKDVDESREVQTGSSLPTSSRVVPRNPRFEVYGGTLNDISEFFSSGNYDPNAVRNSEEGPRKLFTKEEKTLLNRRVPDLAIATSGKWLPLHTLAASGEFYLTNTLLKHCIDINGQDKHGLTALHKSILSKKQAIFNYLLRESANPFICDQDGASLMHYAVLTASSQMIKILLLYNVDINLQDNYGWSPLHLAVQTRRTDLVKLLLIKGADKTLKNGDGLTPLDLCLFSGQNTRTYELIKLIKQFPRE